MTKPPAGPSLFDLFDEPTPKVLIDPSVCEHPAFDPTETVWEVGEPIRWTWTCRLCGFVKGRCTNKIQRDLNH